MNAIPPTLASLVDASTRVGATSARLAKVRALADFLKAVPVDELATAVFYLSGTLPQGRIGIGYSTLQAAARQRPSEDAQLSIHAVDALIASIATTRGSGSASRRAALLAELFARATETEQGFLLRLLAGELRQGALDGVMIDAIASAAGIAARVVRRAAMYAQGLGTLATAALSGGERGLDRFQLRLFDPVLPMLAQTASDVDEVLHELSSPVQFDWKLDGARIQVHKRGADVRIYTRALNEMSAAIPEIVEATRSLGVDEAVLDGEAISYTPAGRPQPFQVTMRRFGRRVNVASLLDELPMRAFFFDCLLVNGEVIADRPLAERIRALDGAVPDAMRIPRLVTGDARQANAFYDAALAAGHEGVMAKSLDSVYEAGNRGASWFKIKRAHTLDLIVLAAEWGHGRRTGLLSNLHLGALDPATGEYVMLGKTFKGLTDQTLEWQTRELLARETHRDRMTVHVRPELVVEIAFSDLQASPRYPGGLALRLARVKRYREDKSAAEADTMASVRRISAAQG